MKPERIMSIEKCSHIIKSNREKKYWFLVFLALILSTVFKPETVKSQDTTFPAGAFIIDMGLVPQTIANSLKPYGLIYDLIIHDAVDVKWIIDPAKSKDGTDFIYNGYAFKGGPFVIPFAYRNASVDAKLVTWQALGVKGITTTSPITVPVFKTLSVSSVPRWTLDKQNGAIATTFFANAGIPSTAYGGGTSATWKNPADLGPCDDIFIMPHANPTWATHGHLLDWNQVNKGSIWLGCNAGSALEDMFNPANPSQQTNFLSEKISTAASTGALYNNPYYENALTLWTHHTAGGPPYSYDNGGDPVMQFMGPLDAATQQGVEQIYIPTNGGTYNVGGGWRATTKIGGFDPDHAQKKGTDAKYKAAVIAYGYAYGDAERGMVMLEASHNIATASLPPNVAAQRAFFNFSFLAGKVTAPDPGFNVQIGILTSGNDVPISFTVSPPRIISEFNVEWISSCGGSFREDPAHAGDARYTIFSVPQVSGPTNCIVSITLTEKSSCGRIYKNSVASPVSCGISAITSIIPACYGLSSGSISMSITGGAAPFVWSWTKSGGGTGSGTGTTISNLASGTYSVDVVASNGTGCATSFTVTVNANTEITATATPTNIVCNGRATGSIDLAITGGTPAYTYVWADGPTTQNRSGLVPGTYSVTVTDSKGCTKAASAIITQPTAQTITPTITNILCNGNNTGAISLGSTPAFTTETFAWSDGVATQNRTALLAGTYSVTVTNALGCPQIVSGMVVAQPTAITTSAAASAIACNGGTSTITVTASGGTGTLQYSLNGAAYQAGNTFSTVAASATPYNISVKDANNCTKSTTVLVSQPATLALSTAITRASCPGVSDGGIDLTVAGGTAPFSYDWSDVAGTSNSEDRATIPSGSYTVTVTDARGCSTAPTTVVVTNINPNPVTPGTISK